MYIYIYTYIHKYIYIYTTVDWNKFINEKQFELHCITSTIK